jgi:hypothetical protein
LRFTVESDTDAVFTMGMQHVTGDGGGNSFQWPQQLTATATPTAHALYIRDIAAANPALSLNDIMAVTVGTGTAGIRFSSVRITSPDYEAQPPIIRVNQAGYFPYDEKIALVAHFSRFGNLNGHTFEVINAATQEVAYSGTLSDAVQDTPMRSGERVHIADFTNLTAPGRYFIRIPAAAWVDDSFAFNIGMDVYDTLLVDLLRYFYFQRDDELLPQHAGIFARAPIIPHHPDGIRRWSDRYNPDAPRHYGVGFQGWYDAGDFGKYVTFTAGAITDLLLMYDLWPQLFYDGQLNIPESGNGAPDILDEIKFALDFILAMEHSSGNGTFYHVANFDVCPTTGNAELFIIDTRDPADTHGNLHSTLATAVAAAHFAYASILFAGHAVHESYAALLLETAIRAWDYLAANPDELTIIRGGGNVAAGPNFEFPGGASPDMTALRHTLTREKFVAAAALYRATGEARFADFIYAHHNDTTVHAWTDQWSHFGLSGSSRTFMGFFHYLHSMHSSRPAVRDFFYHHFRARPHSVEAIHTGTFHGNPWRNPLPEWSRYWSSNQQMSHIAMQVLLGNIALGDDSPTANAMVRDTFHYLLGRNELSLSYVSGHGENAVRNVFSGIFTSTNRLDPFQIPPGYVPGGPNYLDNRWASRFRGKAFVDSVGNWTANENAIYYTSSVALITAAVMGMTITEQRTAPAPQPQGLPAPSEHPTPPPAAIIDTNNNPSNSSNGNGGGNGILWLVLGVLAIPLLIAIASNVYVKRIKPSHIIKEAKLCD